MISFCEAVLVLTFLRCILVLRKRPADDLQTTADEQAKPPATSRLGVLKKASRLKKLNAPGPSPLAVEGDMDVVRAPHGMTPHLSNKNFRTRRAQWIPRPIQTTVLSQSARLRYRWPRPVLLASAKTCTQAPEPLGPWALGVKGVKLFFGLGANEVPPGKS